MGSTGARGNCAFVLPLTREQPLEKEFLVSEEAVGFNFGSVSS